MTIDVDGEICQDHTRGATSAAAPLVPSEEQRGHADVVDAALEGALR